MIDLEPSLSITEGRKVSSGGLFGKSLTGKDLVGDSTSDGHHGGTSVVKLSIHLTDLLGGFLFPVVDLSQTDSVVTIELGGGPPGELNETTNEQNLQKTSRGDLEETTDASADIRELEIVGGGQVSVKGPVVVVDKCTQHSHHGDAAVLLLDSAVTLERSLVSDVSEGIEKAKRGRGANLHVGRIDSRGRSGGLKFSRFSRKTMSEVRTENQQQRHCDGYERIHCPQHYSTHTGVLTGAKAAAEPTRAARIANFILVGTTKIVLLIFSACRDGCAFQRKNVPSATHHASPLCCDLEAYLDFLRVQLVTKIPS